MKKKVMDRFKVLPEAREIHLITGKLEVEKSCVHPSPQHTASLVETRIAKFGAVHDTDTSVSNRL
jgi:hypothetical protein